MLSIWVNVRQPSARWEIRLSQLGQIQYLQRRLLSVTVNLLCVYVHRMREEKALSGEFFENVVYVGCFIFVKILCLFTS